jgi:single-strand DNA-binding protein
MNGLYITVDGVVGTDPKRRVWNGDPVISFRLVTKERRYDRSKGGWIDGHSSWMTVTCFRALAKNVDECVRKGDRLIVHGRARVKDYVAEGGAQRTAVDLEADGVGHNLMFVTARFRPAKTAENVEDRIRAQADELMRELADQPLEDVETLIAQRAARIDDEPDEYDRPDDPDESLDDELDEELDEESGDADEPVGDEPVGDAADEDPHRSPDEAHGGRKPQASRRKVLAGLTG